LPDAWDARSQKSMKKKSRTYERKEPAHARASLSGQQITAARKNLQLSQRALASHIGKSQSWVRDVESGRLQVSSKDQQLLLNVLGAI